MKINYQDPDVTLARMRELVESIRQESDCQKVFLLGDELAEHVAALDAWMIKGGSLPIVWQR